MASTYEKMHALADELRTQAIGDTSEEMGGFVAVVQMAAGMGIDVFAWIIPDDPAEADTFVDQLLALLLRVRGDDLPPFDPNLYGEAVPLADDDRAAGMVPEESSGPGLESGDGHEPVTRPHETPAAPDLPA